MSEPTSAPVPRAATLAELTRLVNRLSKAGDAKSVVRLVERWGEEADLPRDARLAAARAFLDLKLMDRAWVQLRELTDADGDDLEAQALTAEMFIERGWPDRARRPLERISRLTPDHPKLAGLVGRLTQAPPRAPADARELERTGSPEALMDLAEVYLRTGSILRAQGILERLRRGGGGDQDRVEMLLWGVRGDFGSPGVDLMDLARELRALHRQARPLPAALGGTGLRGAAPRLPDPADWEGLERTESGIDAPDPETAEISKSALGAQLAGLSRSERSFPSLFRDEGVTDSSEVEDEEVTVATVMAGDEELQDPPTAEDTDAGFQVAPGMDRGDTQIMQVISSNGERRLAPVDGPTHIRRDDGGDGAALRQTLDLRAWQHSMGVDPSPESTRDDASTGGFLEEEDQDLVVMTRRSEPVVEPAAAPLPRRAPIEVVEKVPEPPPLPEGLPGQDEDTPSITPIVPDEPQRPPTPIRRSVAPDAAEEGARTRQTEVRWGLILPGLVLLVLLAGALAWFALQARQSVARDDVVGATHQAIAQGDLPALSAQDASLNARIDAGSPPLGLAMAGRALVDAQLWAEHSGDPNDYADAAAGIAAARAAGGADDEVALAEATLALGEGHLPRARAALARLSPAALRGEVGRFLAARVALVSGDAAGAWQALGPAPAPTGAWHAAFVPVVLAAAGDANGAATASQDALRRFPAATPVLLAALEYGWLWTDAAGRLDQVDALLKGGSLASPRERARALRVRAGLLRGAGRAAEARVAEAQARESDPNGPDSLYEAAALALVGGDTLSAEKAFAHCLSRVSAEARCQRGRVQAQLELDRVNEARSAVDAWKADGLDVAVLDGWVTLQQGDPAAGRALTAPALAEDARGEPGRVLPGLAWYVRGMALGEEGGAVEEADEALGRAMRRLAASSDPLLQALGGRAEAARIRYGAAALAKERLARLKGRDADPVMQLLIAGHFEQQGDTEAARLRLDRAAELGRESALAHYARGLFYYNPSTQSAALEAWRRYLDLGPGGPRAERVRQRINRL